VKHWKSAMVAVLLVLSVTLMGAAAAGWKIRAAAAQAATNYCIGELVSETLREGFGLPPAAGGTVYDDRCDPLRHAPAFERYIRGGK